MIGARDYYGAHLGALSELHHGVSGDVYAVDSRTLFLKNFNYDGEGPGKFRSFLLIFDFLFRFGQQCVSTQSHKLIPPTLICMSASDQTDDDLSD